MISIDRSLLQSCFVRLACVRHAASVHPEPGSNSQKISYLNNPFGLLKPYFSIAYSALKRIFYFSLFLLRPFCKEPIFGALLPLGNSLLFVLFCSIFKVHRPASLEASLINISLGLLLCQGFFSAFFKLFFDRKILIFYGLQTLYL